MRIPPHQLSVPTSPVDNRALTKSSIFQRSGSKTGASKELRSSLPLERGDLMAIAADLKSGLIDREEASGRFVGAVIDHSLKGKLGASDREKLLSDIKEFFANDADFAQKLAKNLHDLI